MQNTENQEAPTINKSMTSIGMHSTWPAKNECDGAGNNVTRNSVLCATLLVNEKKICMA